MGTGIAAGGQGAEEAEEVVRPGGEHQGDSGPVRQAGPAQPGRHPRRAGREVGIGDRPGAVVGLVEQDMHAGWVPLQVPVEDLGQGPGGGRLACGCRLGQLGPPCRRSGLGLGHPSGHRQRQQVACRRRQQGLIRQPHAEPPLHPRDQLGAAQAVQTQVRLQPAVQGDGGDRLRQPGVLGKAAQDLQQAGSSVALVGGMRHPTV